MIIEIEDMDIHDDEVVVRLERKSLKVKARIDCLRKSSGGSI